MSLTGGASAPPSFEVMMKVRMTRTLFHGNHTLAEGQEIEVGNPDWWVSRGFAVPVEPYAERYETKPHPARPMLAGGEETQPSSSPPARPRRGRPPKRREGTE